MNYRAVFATFVLLVSSAAALAQVLPATPAAAPQNSDADFTVGDIKIEGLQRISEGTVLTTCPSTSATASTRSGCARHCGRFTPPASFATSP